MRAHRLVALPFLVFLAVLAATASAAAQSLFRVPQNGDLQAAINSVADGGVIEIAAGTYASPPNGWQITNERKGFTVRAAQGAQVVLDGGGSRRIVRYENGTRARGKLVTFEGLTFRHGAGGAGTAAVALVQAEAAFRNCVFEDTAASTASDYGAVRVFTGSEAGFTGCIFRGNRSRVRGGAVAIEFASATFQGCTFLDNRVNTAGHDPGSAGGGVYVLDSTVRIADSHFEGNEAGWVGGALYAIGLWKEPLSTPAVDVQVSRSTFLDNRAEPHACCPPPGPTTGGAVHAEDHVSILLEGSRFVGNEAEHGGAVSGYRAIVEVHGSVFQGNRSLPPGTGVGAGGAINLTSNDFADPSQPGAEIDFRPARLTVTDSFFQGRFGATAAAAHVGGCLLAGGDASRMYSTLPGAGNAALNRAVVVVRNTVFFDCDVEPNAAGDGGFGGAIQADLTDLTLEDSMLLHSDARGGGSGGGALAVSRESDVEIARTTFARNTGESRAGAIDLGGSTLQMTGSRFLANEVSPGDNEGNNQSLGAALYAIPFLARGRDVAGVVSNTLFSDNVGVPVFDIDPQSGPINDLRYDGNEFFSSRPVYVNTFADPGRQGSSVAQLNALTVVRPGRPSTDKSQVPNRQLNAAPRVGDLVAAPPTVPVGAPASPSNTFIAYAWTGGQSATLNGQPLSGRSGVVEVAAPGTYTLAVNGTPVDTVTVGTASCTAGPRLCLRNDRFRLEVSWRTAQGQTGAGQAVALSGDTGSFWFFDPANVELMVKVLDGRPLNGHFWVFYGALTNVQYTLTVTDTVTGRVKIYTNPQGQLASRSDTSAFPAPAGGAAAADASRWNEEPAVSAPALSALDKACAAGATQLCLNASRFRVQVTWEAQGQSGSGQAVPLTSDTGYFWFFDPANVELVLKILDGRGLNGHFWVFYGALSDVRYTITVTDTETGKSKTYVNPAGTLASVADTQALSQ